MPEFIPDRTERSVSMDKTVHTEELSRNRYHHCMTARYHEGDENGKSQAKFATYVLSDEARAAGYLDVWLEYEDSVTVKESSSNVMCSQKPACVFMERKHSGDENASTTYQISRVVASRLREDGSTMIHPCIVKNTSVTTNEKESKAGWVEQKGKVIIGRSHSGDENGKTVTTFGEVYILDDRNGNTYPLNLVNEAPTDVQKESNSDFYVDKKPENAPNQFQVWGSKVLGSSAFEHIWVESLSPRDNFRSNGNQDKLYPIQLVDVEAETYSIVNDYRNTGGWGNDAMGIIYAVEGVCHQISNRCILPTVGVSIKAKNVRIPWEYRKTCAYYGIAGKNYDKWYNTVYLASRNKFVKGAQAPAHQAEEGKGLGYFDLESEARELSRSAEMLLRDAGIIGDGEKNPIAEEQREWLIWQEALLKRYGFLEEDGKIRIPENLTEEKVREFCRILNEERPDLMAALKEKIGAEKYREYTGTDETKGAIVDAEMAIRCYLKK